MKTSLADRHDRHWNITAFFERMDIDGAQYNEQTHGDKELLLKYIMPGFHDLKEDVKQWFVSSDWYHVYSRYVQLAQSWDALEKYAMETYRNSTQIVLNELYRIDMENPHSQYDATSGSIRWICQDTNQMHSYTFLTLLLPCLLLILISSFIPTRKNLFKNCCGMKPAIIYPVDFIKDPFHRLEYATLICLMANRVLLMFDGKRFFSIDKFEDDDWVVKWGWTNIFLQTIQVVIVCICFYPMFVFISKRRYLAFNICGIIGSLVWASEDVLIIVSCSLMQNRNHITVPRVVIQVPLVGIYLILIATFSIDLKKNILHKLGRTPATKLHKHERELEYLECLLKKVEKPKPKNRKEHVVQFFTYERLPGYRYSVRVVCTMALALTCLYQVAVRSISSTHNDIDAFLDYKNDMVQYLQEQFSFKPAISRDHLTALKYCFEISVYFAFFIQLGLMIHALVTHRNHLRKAYRGDYSWCFDRKPPPRTIVSFGLKYSGYQVAYLLYGFVIMTALLTLTCLFFSYAIILPIKHKYTNYVTDKLIQLWPTLIISLGIFFGQKLLAHYCFLEDGDNLALTNRRAFNVFSYVMLFFNILVGLFSCLSRVLVSVVLGLFFISRLDRCLLLPGFESFDDGYTAYVSMVRLDVQHSHPLLRIFVYLLQNSVVEKKVFRRLTTGHMSQASSGAPLLPSTDSNQSLLDASRTTASTFANNNMIATGVGITDERRDHEHEADAAEHRSLWGTYMQRLGVAIRSNNNWAEYRSLESNMAERISNIRLKNVDYSRYTPRRRNMWWKLITMWNNPTIAQDKIRSNERRARDEKRQQGAGEQEKMQKKMRERKQETEEKCQMDNVSTVDDDSLEAVVVDNVVLDAVVLD